MNTTDLIQSAIDAGFAYDLVCGEVQVDVTPAEAGGEGIMWRAGAIEQGARYLGQITGEPTPMGSAALSTRRVYRFALDYNTPRK